MAEVETELVGMLDALEKISPRARELIEAFPSESVRAEVRGIEHPIEMRRLLVSGA